MRSVNLNALCIFLICHYTRLYHDILFVIDYSIEFLGRNSEQIANLIRQTAEIPDVCYWNYQFDVTGTFATHLLLSHLYTASVADNTLITDALILAATALVILGRTEDTLAEETIALGFICTVIYSLWLGNLAITAFEDFLRRSKTDGNLRKIILYL